MAVATHHLVLRGTFIDADCNEDTTLRRTRSVSASRKNACKDDLFADKAEYVKTLSVRSDAILSMKPEFSKPVFSEPVKLTAANLSNIKGASKMNRLSSDSFGSASTTASNLTSISTVTTTSQFLSFDNDLDMGDDDKDEFQAETQMPKVPEPYGGSECSTEDLPTDSVGSYGHPDLCMHPCIFYAKGACTSGKDCTFCHMDHSKRAQHLDKRKRQTLKAMTYTELAWLITPLLQDKAAELGLSREAQDLIEMIVNAPDIDYSNYEGVNSTKQVAQKALSKTLNGMTFVTLVLLLIGRGDAPQSVRGTEVQEAISKVRFAWK